MSQMAFEENELKVRRKASMKTAFGLIGLVVLVYLGFIAMAVMGN